MMNNSGIQQEYPSLTEILHACESLAVAVSGGVDSMTLAAMAHLHNADTTLYHAISPAVPEAATERVKLYAERFGWQLAIIDAGEMHDPEYRANPVNRCYYCKSNLYTAISDCTDGLIVSGTNLDDLADYRPGLTAAQEVGVRHPFVEAGLNKQAVRALAAQLGLHDLASLPASPCLSSRVTTGITIEESLLPLIDEVEQCLRALLNNFSRDLRCRIRYQQVAIEMPHDDFSTLSSTVQADIIQAVRNVFSNTPHASLAESIVLEPYRMGSAFVTPQPVHIRESS